MVITSFQGPRYAVVNVLDMGNISIKQGLSYLEDILAVVVTECMIEEHISAVVGEFSIDQPITTTAVLVVYTIQKRIVAAAVV